MIEFTCLCCEGQHTKPGKKHFPCNTKCDMFRTKHYDWCRTCTKLILEKFEEQFAKPKLRVEDDAA